MVRISVPRHLPNSSSSSPSKRAAASPRPRDTTASNASAPFPQVTATRPGIAAASKAATPRRGKAILYTISFAAVTAAGALYGAGLKIQQDASDANTALPEPNPPRQQDTANEKDESKAIEKHIEALKDRRRTFESAKADLESKLARLHKRQESTTEKG